jgi:hypothetical protein
VILGKALVLARLHIIQSGARGKHNWRKIASPLIARILANKRRKLVLTPVAVEKVAFLEKLSKFGDRKCPGDSRESFIAHPGAILFSRFSREGVFQQPQAFALTILREQAGSTRPRL